jgi:hypothetical protein
MEQESEAYRKAEGKLAGVMFVVFLVWCPIYILMLRPVILSFLGIVPILLHLLLVLAPIVLLALILGRFLPPKQG